MSTANEPAFPRPTEITKPVYITPNGEDMALVFSAGGLTKRELLAAMAMQGLCSQPETERDRELSLDEATKEIASIATAYADALLAALTKDGAA